VCLDQISLYVYSYICYKDMGVDAAEFLLFGPRTWLDWSFITFWDSVLSSIEKGSFAGIARHGQHRLGTFYIPLSRCKLSPDLSTSAHYPLHHDYNGISNDYRRATHQRVQHCSCQRTTIHCGTREGTQIDRISQDTTATGYKPGDTRRLDCFRAALPIASVCHCPTPLRACHCDDQVHVRVLRGAKQWHRRFLQGDV